MNSCIFFEIQKMFGKGSRFPRDCLGNGSVKSGKLFLTKMKEKLIFFVFFLDISKKSITFARHFVCVAYEIK